ncbi:rare lipoprotein A [Rhodobium orientis]|nr:rare lipoprotein A [Rhodobium orientis]
MIQLIPLWRGLIAASIVTMVAAGGTAAIAKTEKGRASWYAMTSRTASGERANPNAMTAAHRRLKFGTRVKVTNKRNGRSVVVCINDRGPFVRGRIIDVTRAAAKELGFIRAGSVMVDVDVVGRETDGCA